LLRPAVVGFFPVRCQSRRARRPRLLPVDCGHSLSSVSSRFVPVLRLVPMEVAELELKSSERPITTADVEPAALPLPDEVRPMRLELGYTCSIVGIHLFSLLAFVPWSSSWTGVVLAVIGLPIY